MKKRLLIINGSPRKNKTSYSFARTIKKISEEDNNICEIIHVIDYFNGNKGFDELNNIILKSDAIGLVAPLYVDTLPYPVIWFFEKIIEESKDVLKGKSFFAIGQSGFPDITVNEPLLGSCKCFANMAEMKWLGGLSYGGGAIIDGKHLEDLGKKGEKIISGFKIALHDIFNNKQISPKAQELITINIPKILYRPLAAYLNYNSRKIAKKNGVTDLERKYYLE